MQSERAEVLRQAVMIIWDEITMAEKRAVGIVDQLLRDVAGVETPFGGKLFIISGDWRQLLPVVVRGSRSAIVNATVKRSELWPLFRVVTLCRAYP